MGRISRSGIYLGWRPALEVAPIILQIVSLIEVGGDEGLDQRLVLHLIHWAVQVVPPSACLYATWKRATRCRCSLNRRRPWER